MPENTVCVDRTTGYGNPFPVIKETVIVSTGNTPTWCVGTWTGPAMWFLPSRAEAQVRSVDAYRAWLNMPPQSNLRERAKLALRGKNLACWCPLDQPCHADVLIDLANSTAREGEG